MRLKEEADKAVNDLVKIQEFDFENATEEELKTFIKFVEKRQEHNRKLREQLEKYVNELKEKEKK